MITRDLVVSEPHDEVINFDSGTQMCMQCDGVVYKISQNCMGVWQPTHSELYELVSYTKELEKKLKKIQGLTTK